MKNNKFYYNIKLPFIIWLMVFAGNVAKTQTNTVLKQIDSLPIYEKINIAKKNIETAHRDNIFIAEFTAMDYIKKHIDKKDLADFMQICVVTHGQDYYYWNNMELWWPETTDMMADIKKNYKWFDNLMKYLYGKINDKAFYDTGFFTTINEPTYGFYSNLYLIERCSGFIERHKNDTISFNSALQR